jgi:hypothetical protein
MATEFEMAAAAGLTLGSYYEAQVREWLDLKMVTGRYSSILVSQLVQHIEQRTMNVFAIYDEVEALERPDIPQCTSYETGRSAEGYASASNWKMSERETKGFEGTRQRLILKRQWKSTKWIASGARCRAISRISRDSQILFSLTIIWLKHFVRNRPITALPCVGLKLEVLGLETKRPAAPMHR